MRLMVIVGSTQADTINQEELEYLIGLNNRIRKMKEIRNQHAANLLRRLRMGAMVDPGTHVAEIETEETGPQRREFLIVR